MACAAATIWLAGTRLSRLAMTRRPSWPVAPVTTIMCLFTCLFSFWKVITTIVRPTDCQQILGSVLVETKKARS